MNIFISLATIVVLTVWCTELKALFRSCTGCLTRFIQAARERSRDLLGSSVEWLDGTHRTRPQPIDVIRVAFVLILSFVAAAADYIVISNTLTVIWPGAGAQVMAVSMVLLTAMVGLALHVKVGLGSRAFLLAVLTTLVLTSGTLAYLRTAELVSLGSSSPLPQVESSHLVFKNQGATPESVQPRSPEPPRGVPLTTVFPLLGAGLAILFALGEAIGFWCCFSVAEGVPLAWICLFPFLLAVAVIWGLLEIMITADITGCVASFADAMFDALFVVRSFFLRACTFWSPAAIRERRRLQLYPRYRLWVEWARIEAMQEMERCQLEAEVRQSTGSIEKVVSHLWQAATELCVEAHTKHFEVVKREQPKDTDSLDGINFASDVRLVLAKLQGRDGLDRTDSAVSAKRRPI
jgi:hypothetical protein